MWHTRRCICSLRGPTALPSCPAQSTTRVKPFICTMPMRLDDGWNQIQFNLSDFTRRAYGKDCETKCRAATENHRLICALWVVIYMSFVAFLPMITCFQLDTLLWHGVLSFGQFAVELKLQKDRLYRRLALSLTVCQSSISERSALDRAWTHNWGCRSMYHWIGLGLGTDSLDSLIYI